MRVELNHTKWDIEPIDQKQLFIIYAISKDAKGKEVRTKHLNYATIKQVKVYLMKCVRCGIEDVVEAVKSLEYE